MRASDIPGQYLDPRAGLSKATEFRLTPGKEYIVYALAFRHDQVWYYLCDDVGLWYPAHHPAPLFEVTDPSLSRHWAFAFTPRHADHLALIAFPEWARDQYFYDRLTDRQPTEVAIFQRIKEAMDAEGFPRSTDA